MAEAWTDRQMLDILDHLERFGDTAAEVATVYHTSRGAICGLQYRVRQACAAEDKRRNRAGDLDAAGGPVRRAENKDGGMTPRWWDLV